MDGDVCRLCLQKEPFLKILCDQTIVEKIKTFCTVNVNDCDRLPKHICSLCKDKIEDIVDFKKLCERNDEFLRESFKVDVKIEYDSDSPCDYLWEDASFKPEPLDEDNHLSERKKNNLKDKKDRIKNKIQFKSHIKKDKKLKKKLKIKTKSKKIKNIISNNEADSLTTENGSLEIENGEIKEKTKFRCELCKKSFAKKINLEHHILRHQEMLNGILKIEINDRDENGDCKDNKEFYCYLCKRYIQIRYIQFHLECSNSDEYGCKYCNAKFNSKICQRGHRKSHIVVKKSKRIYKPRPKVKKQPKSPTSNRGDNCPICGQYFDGQHFEKHVQTHNPKPFECDECHKSFNTRAKLKPHLESHAYSRQMHQCYMCGKCFRNRDGVQKHMQIHLITSLVNCEICGKMLTKSSMKAHIKSHTTERNFECDICGQRFKTKKGVTDHVQAHFQKKVVYCKYCDSKFADMKTLKDHEMLHTGERPHHCPVCDKGFIQLSNMKSHFRNNHKGIEFIYKSKRMLKREAMFH